LLQEQSTRDIFSVNKMLVREDITLEPYEGAAVTLEEALYGDNRLTSLTMLSEKEAIVPISGKH
jgi:hypothetical protein